MEMSDAICVACKRQIDAAAKTCPYCGADPRSGDRVDTQALLQEVFRPREVSTTESVLDYARQRQGIVVAAGVVLLVLLLTGLNAFLKSRNEHDVQPAIPLAEVTDLGAQQEQSQQTPMPELSFQYEGKPQTLRTFVLEPGAVTPPEVITAQQTAAQRAQQAAAAKNAPQPTAPATPANARPPQAPQVPQHR